MFLKRTWKKIVIRNDCEYLYHPLSADDLALLYGSKNESIAEQKIKWKLTGLISNLEIEKMKKIDVLRLGKFVPVLAISIINT